MEMNNDQYNEFNEKLGRIKNELIPIFQNYIVPIFILPSQSSCGLIDVITNGTGFLLNLHGKYLLVTCSHVWEEFIHLNSPNATIGAAMGNNKLFNLSKQLPIANSKERDIAIFDVSHHVVNEKFGNKSFYVPQTWPPRRPKENDLVLVLGYPGMFRQPTQGNINIVFILDFIRNISDNTITLRDENNERKMICYNDLLPDLNDFGGFSGAPAFAQYDEDKWTFIGIMYEGAYQIYDSPVGIISITHADFIISASEIR